MIIFLKKNWYLISIVICFIGMMWGFYFMERANDKERELRKTAVDRTKLKVFPKQIVSESGAIAIFEKIETRELGVSGPSVFVIYRVQN